LDYVEISSMNKFGSRLKQLREAKSLTQLALAEKSGVGKTSIRNIEQGIGRYPRFDTMVALAKALGVSLDEFVIEPAIPAKSKHSRRQ